MRRGIRCGSSAYRRTRRDPSQARSSTAFPRLTARRGCACSRLKVPIRQIANLSAKYRIIITHGNGPQVGNLLLQQESCKEVPRLPLEILVAQTQGQIGYMIESTLDEALMAMGVNDQPLVSLISYVVVDETDPALHEAAV